MSGFSFQVATRVGEQHAFIESHEYDTEPQEVWEFLGVRGNLLCNPRDRGYSRTCGERVRHWRAKGLEVRQSNDSANDFVVRGDDQETVRKLHS